MTLPARNLHMEEGRGRGGAGRVTGFGFDCDFDSNFDSDCGAVSADPGLVLLGTHRSVSALGVLVLAQTMAGGQPYGPQD